MIKTITRVLYGFFGTLFLASGVGVFLPGTGLLPQSLKDVILGFGGGNGHTMHVIQELGSLMVFTGLITFWFMRNYERSRVYHWSMTVFFALFALAHWFDSNGVFASGIGQMVNTIPFVLFGLVGLIRETSKAG